jgi:AbrB family looped-hinge helix DNA binding protein
MDQEIKDIRTVRITSKGQISIPASLRARAGFKEGSKVSVIAYEDKVELRPLNKMTKMSDAMFATFASEEVLAKNWLSEEDEEAWSDL